MNSQHLPPDPLLKVCKLLNEHHVRYLVVGGHACILHGLVRTTEDVDILVEESRDNYQRIIAALSELEDHAARELQVDDFDKHIVIKVADEVEVDISRRAWTVDFREAKPNARQVVIENVMIPYLGLKDLMKSKATYRDKDRWDIQKLRELNNARENGQQRASGSLRLLDCLKRFLSFGG